MESKKVRCRIVSSNVICGTCLTRSTSLESILLAEHSGLIMLVRCNCLLSKPYLARSVEAVITVDVPVTAAAVPGTLKPAPAAPAQPIVAAFGEVVVPLVDTNTMAPTAAITVTTTTTPPATTTAMRMLCISVSVDTILALGSMDVSTMVDTFVDDVDIDVDDVDVNVDVVGETSTTVIKHWLALGQNLVSCFSACTSPLDM